MREGTGVLTLTGTPPSQVSKSLRVLDQLGILSIPILWEMMGQVDVDPLFLIRTIRGHKDDVGFLHEEHLIGDSLAFVAGDKTAAGYKVAYHVNVFTNDVTVMVRDGDKYVQHYGISAGDLFDSLKDIPAGEQRLQTLLDQVKKRVSDGLAYR